MAQITRGEWGDDYPSIRLVGDSSLDLRAEPYMARITYGSVPQEEANANARLIAAAPDLYAALEEALGFLEDTNVIGDLPDTMRAALTKARGEQKKSQRLVPVAERAEIVA